ncbi:DUF1996 domain-containing protein [Dactylosporangium sp. CA-233914]|uniref:DUF1996 domain-containing protein n=1 Tax=Dactylosporangium sp. CA-233914 TaxID=3239934 RepID=UPI003D927E77
MSRLEQQRPGRRRVRWWTAAGAGIVVIGAMLSVSYYASAEEGPDALAEAARWPNDQGPAPECAGTPAKRQNNNGNANNSNGNNGKPTGRPTASAKSTVDPNTSAPSSASPTSAAPSPTSTKVPDKCHADMGGPVGGDFVDIRQVQPARGNGNRNGRNAATGTFVSQCGTNKEGHHNSDNFIVAPGVTNGAHHVHDYVGNVSTDGNSTNESLAAAGTTCRFGDKSAYYWPVLRRTNRQGPDANQDGGGLDGNLGQILEPTGVRLEFSGNSQSKVRAMPQFIRIITGDAKALTNGPANARAKWTCSGFTNRTTTKYPVCPQGSQIQRVLEFPSCWDGKNIDSANHRSHIVFPLASGKCPKKTVAVPRLTMTLSFDRQAAGQFALDSFPEQLHNPNTDHGDFTNVMSTQLMNYAVACINSGRRC